MKNSSAIIVLLMIFSLVLSVNNCSKSTEKDTKQKVIIIGLDGANWLTMDPLIKKGKLPFFKKLKENSAWSDCKSLKPTKSSIIWTSIATGKTMEKHGIMDFAYMKKNKMLIPFSNIEKRSPAIWQILNEYKRRSIVLNWWITFPPDQINGVMVSNAFRKIILKPKKEIDDYKNSVFPIAYFDKIKNHYVENLKNVFKKTGLVDYAKMYDKRNPGKTHRDVAVLKSFRIYTKQDYLINKVADELYNNEEFDLFAVYYRMPDIVQHFVLKLLHQEKFEKLKKYIYASEMPDEKRREILRVLSNILYPTYKYMEKIVKSMITNPKYKNSHFIIVSDHGFNLGPGYRHWPLPDDKPAPDGIFLVHGPDVKKGPVKNISVYDIVPTALYLFGLPVGKDMDGRVVFEAFNKKRPVQYKKYKLNKNKFKRDEKKDAQEIKELKSLGYIDN